MPPWKKSANTACIQSVIDGNLTLFVEHSRDNYLSGDCSIVIEVLPVPTYPFSKPPREAEIDA
jgi:hypothetical protein